MSTPTPVIAAHLGDRLFHWYCIVFWWEETSYARTTWSTSSSWFQDISRGPADPATIMSSLLKAGQVYVIFTADVVVYGGSTAISGSCTYDVAKPSSIQQRLRLPRCHAPNNVLCVMHRVTDGWIRNDINTERGLCRGIEVANWQEISRQCESTSYAGGINYSTTVPDTKLVMYGWSSPGTGWCSSSL